MKIGEQFRHLLLGKATGKTWHHSLASEHHAAHFGIGCRSPARQRGPFEDSMQVGWNLLESQIVVIVAVRTPDGVEMLAIGLLYSEGRGRPASRQQCSACDDAQSGRHPEAKPRASFQLDNLYFSMIPQATRSPEFPDGSDIRSSALAWMTKEVPPS